MVKTKMSKSHGNLHMTKKLAADTTTFDKVVANEHDTVTHAISKLSEYIAKSGKGLLAIFNHFDRSGVGKLSRNDLHSALISLSLEITPAQALSLVNLMDCDGDGQIDVKELDSTMRLFRRRKREGKLHAFHEELLPKDPVFPDILVAREDFRRVFPRFLNENDTSLTFVTEKALRKSPQDRGYEDVQHIANWLSQTSHMKTLGARRHLEIANVVKLEDYTAGQVVFEQGSDADAFYVIFNGSVDVEVDQIHLLSLQKGDTFGELALDSNSTRTATIICSVNFPTTCLVRMRMADYKRVMIKYNTWRMNQKLTLLTNHCRIARGWSASKARTFCYCMAYHSYAPGQTVYLQDENAHSMYIINCGKALLQRTLKYLITNRWPAENGADDDNKFGERQVHKRVTVNVRCLSMGETFGEDCALGYSRRQYQVVAAAEGLEVFSVPKVKALLYLNSSELDALSKETKDIFRFGENDTSQLYYECMEEKRRIINKKQLMYGPTYQKRAQIALLEPKRVKPPRDLPIISNDFPQH